MTVDWLTAILYAIAAISVVIVVIRYSLQKSTTIVTVALLAAAYLSVIAVHWYHQSALRTFQVIVALTYMVWTGMVMAEGYKFYKRHKQTRRRRRR